MTNSSMANIEHIQFIKKNVSGVYSALTSAQGLGSVWTKKLRIDDTVGGVLEFDFNDDYDTKMKVVELAPNKRVEWRCIQSDPQWVGTTISFELAEDKKGTTSVVLRHMHWKEVTEFYRWCNYNWAMFLYSLKLYCEEGTGLPFQDRQF